jgi:hypothetical protein
MKLCGNRDCNTCRASRSRRDDDALSIVQVAEASNLDMRPSTGPSEMPTTPRRQQRNPRSDMLTNSAGGMIGFRKNASASSQMRTRSWQPT